MATDLLVWRDDFRIGIAEVDHEHRRLIGGINALHESVGEHGQPDAVAGFLGELHGLIAAHFALEERVMRSSRYPRLAEHKADHECLLDEIRDIMDGYELSGRYDVAQLREALNRWFGVHFRTHDAALHDGRSARGAT